MNEDLNEAASALDGIYLPVLFAAVETAATLVEEGEVSMPSGYTPRIVPGLLIPGSGNRFLGEGNSGKYRYSHGMIIAAFVDLGEAYVMAAQIDPDDGEPASNWYAVAGVSRLAAIKLKKNFFTNRAVEWRLDDVRDDRAQNDSAERLVVMLPNDVPSDLDHAWQARLLAALTPPG